MKYKYFGILNPTEIDPLDLKQMDLYLLGKGLMVESYRSQVLNNLSTKEIGAGKVRIEVSNKTLSYLYFDDISQTVFEFLIEHYKAALVAEKAIFTRDFDNETFGLSKLKKKKKGLEYFNKYFDLAKEDQQIGLEYNSAGEMEAEKRFKTLFKVKESFKYQLRQQNNLVLAFLIGHLDYFDKEVFKSTPFLVKLFRFENILSILIYLNTKFKFEEDTIFKPKTKAQNIYEHYLTEFNSLKQLEFIEQQLSIKSNINHAFIVSLFFFFKKELVIKIPSAKLFKEIINTHFNSNIGGIKLSDLENKEHLKRLKKLNEVWSKFD
jgi:hypothetical protein